MKNKISSYLLLCFLILFNINNLDANELTFDTSEISVSANGNIINATNGIAISKNENIKIIADNFVYDKIASTLNASGNVQIVSLESDLLISAKNINYNITDNKIISKQSSNIKDNQGNLILMKEFIYDLDDNLVKLNKVKVIDVNKNILKLDLAYLNLLSKKLIGKDVFINFDNKDFDKQNEPRLKGLSFQGDEKNSIINGGVFTTCKKNDDCPPWQFTAKKIRHDKTKKIIYYDKAWLKIYDQPVLYFPKFFHPDPTVKRQSGFLIPGFSESSNLGSAFQVPYFHAISENKDFTLTPSFYSNLNVLAQTEYREINENSENNIDFSFLKTENNNNKNHFFSKSKKNLKLKNFIQSDAFLNVQTTSDDTYLRKYKLKSPIIDNTTTLTSSLGLNLLDDGLSFNTEFHVYENLYNSKNERYEYVLPSYQLSKTIESTFIKNGSLILNSDGFIKNYNTNVLEKRIINDLIYNSNYKYSKIGIQNDYSILIKNTNSDAKNSSTYKETRDHTINSLLQYNLSYPLKKNGINYKDIFKPLSTLKFSPNKSKNKKDVITRIDVDNIFSLNRIGQSDSVEGGLSLSYGVEYLKMNLKDQNIFEAKIASQTRLKEDKKLSQSSTLGKRSSDIVGNFKINPSEFIKFNYDFSVDENMNDTNFESLTSSLQINNFVTSFEYLNENTKQKNSYLTNESSFKFDSNKMIAFKTRKNKETSATEYYNLLFQYRNDCLIAAIDYNKDYYSDRDFKPEENIFFKLTIIPFGETTSPNLKK